MIRVIVESPFRGKDEQQAALYKRFLNACLRDCALRGESPYASHRMLTEALDDSDAQERELGISLGFAWRAAAEKTVVYMNFGISGGMRAGIKNAQELGQPVEQRWLVGWEPSVEDLVSLPREAPVIATP